MERLIQTEWVKLQSGETPTIAVDAYVAMPKGNAAETFPVVVVLQEIFGVNAHIRDVTERAAREGYVAIAPALYQRQVTGFEQGYDEKGFAQGRQYKAQTRAGELLQDIQAAMDYGRSLPQGKEGPCGCIGFCFGGHVAYLAATLPEIAATAVFYGAGITTWCPGEAGATVDRTDQIRGQLWGFFGTEDPLIPLEHVDGVKDALAQHGIDHRIYLYDGANHGFFCDQRDSYDAAAAAAAWEQVRQLLGVVL